MLNKIRVSILNYLSKGKPLKPGWYFIQVFDKAEPARFDGTNFWHNGTKLNTAKVVGLRRSIPLSCPTGCTCTQNSDGSWNVNCIQ